MPPLSKDEEGAATGTGEGCIKMVAMLFALDVLCVVNLASSVMKWCLGYLGIHLENEGRLWTVIGICISL